MRQCVRCSKQFANVLESIDHEQNFKHTYKQMDPLMKAAIVTRAERSFSMFLVGHGVELRPTMNKPIVIERFNDWLPDVPEPNWAG